jgi:hypothetical protein
MTRRYISVVDTAKEVRKALKESFPGQKFSVRSDSYSGGASIHVRWIDGPAKHDVERVAKEFAGATFDGMIDLKSYHASEFNGEQVHWGADFVFCDRDLSDDERERVRPLVVEAIERAYGTTALAPSRYYEGICVDGIDRVLAGGIDQMIAMASEYQALKPEEPSV